MTILVRNPRNGEIDYQIEAATALEIAATARPLPRSGAATQATPKPSHSWKPKAPSPSSKASTNWRQYYPYENRLRCDHSAIRAPSRDLPSRDR